MAGLCEGGNEPPDSLKDARTCKLVSKCETEVTGGQEGRKEARRTGNMCPGVELTDEGMYGLCLRVVTTQRAYQREFGVRNPPERNTILGLVNKLEATGSLVSEKGKHRSSRLPTVVVDVRARLEQSPKKSLRRLSLSLLSNWTMNLWPSRSPDLTTPNFFLWGYLKDRVYATRPQTLDDLKHNITQEIQAIDNRVLQRVASNMERRLSCALCRMEDIFNICYRDKLKAEQHDNEQGITRLLLTVVQRYEEYKDGGQMGIYLRDVAYTLKFNPSENCEKPDSEDDHE
ncbi:hypothetical protein ANN_15473 [Periplaneta americana]|uniref:DUF4817 domain-containing protein n=1 Tax=Periplaneta americana TaxID=6978 RepID=A0ABQ8SHC1_PERAM|nr:hypothetical protein ANN_15473 [Periplaneta americana]